MTRARTRHERTIGLSLVCEAPPTRPGIEFGLQDKSSALLGGSSEPDGSVRFEGEIRAVSLDDGTVRLGGQIVHGPPSARFLYLSCRGKAQPDPGWIFRLKVPLAGIPPNARSVESRVRVSAGGTVPLLEGGWTRLK